MYITEMLDSMFPVSKKTSGERIGFCSGGCNCPMDYEHPEDLHFALNGTACHIWCYEAMPEIEKKVFELANRK